MFLEAKEKINCEVFLCEKVVTDGKQSFNENQNNEDEEDLELQQILALSKQEYFEQQKGKGGQDGGQGQDFGGFM